MLNKIFYHMIFKYIYNQSEIIRNHFCNIAGKHKFFLCLVP